MKTIIITIAFLSAIACNSKTETPAPRNPTATELNEWTVVGVQGHCIMYHRVLHQQNVYWSVCSGDDIRFANSAMSTY